MKGKESKRVSEREQMLAVTKNEKASDIGDSSKTTLITLCIPC